MITHVNILYSKSSLARIWGCPVSQIVRFEVWDKVCFVIRRGHRPTFVSKKLFHAEFVSFRVRGARDCQVSFNPMNDLRFWVLNQKKDHEYSVELYESSSGEILSRCSCHDYENQGEHILFIKQAIGPGYKRRCKHQIATELFLRSRGMNLEDRFKWATETRYEEDLEAKEREAYEMIFGV